MAPLWKTCAEAVSYTHLECITGKVEELELPKSLEDISSTRIRENIDKHRDISSLIDPVVQELSLIHISEDRTAGFSVSASRRTRILMLHGGDAVSYTHLDVYKRQAEQRGAVQKSEADLYYLHLYL